jgi:hypothetical protein
MGLVAQLDETRPQRALTLRTQKVFQDLADVGWVRGGFLSIHRNRPENSGHTRFLGIEPPRYRRSWVRGVNRTAVAMCSDGRRTASALSHA